MNWNFIFQNKYEKKTAHEERSSASSGKYRKEDIEKICIKNVKEGYEFNWLQINNYHSRAFCSWRANSRKPGGFEGFFCGYSGINIWVHQPAEDFLAFFVEK